MADALRRIELSKLAEALHARLEGDETLTITGAAEPAAAGPDDLALAMQPRFAEGLSKGEARVAVLWEGADWRGLGLKAALFVSRPRYAMAGITRALDPGPEIASGFHPSAIIDPSAQVAPGAAIGPLAVIGPHVRIGPNARIAPHVTIAEGAEIGEDVLLHSGVRIGRNVRIGDRFIAQPGAVVGGDGCPSSRPRNPASNGPANPWATRARSSAKAGPASIPWAASWLATTWNWARTAASTRAPSGLRGWATG